MYASAGAAAPNRSKTPTAPSARFRPRERTENDQDDAFTLAEAYGYPWYASVIAAVALRTDASMLLSEDLQDGQRIESLTISNPFAV